MRRLYVLLSFMLLAFTASAHAPLSGHVSILPDIHSSSATFQAIEQSEHCTLFAVEDGGQIIGYAVVAWVVTDALPSVARGVCRNLTSHRESCDVVYAVIEGLVELRGAGIARGITRGMVWASRRKYTKSMAEVATKTYEWASAIKSTFDAYAKSTSCSSNVPWNAVNISNNGPQLLSRAELLFPDLSQRVLENNELSRFSKWELSQLRNSIYARHGYEFHLNPDIIRYFNTQNWYRSIRYKTRDSGHIYEKRMNWYERKNIEKILRYEG